MSGRALIAAEMARLNAKGGKRYRLEDYAPFYSNEIGAMQWYDGYWSATACAPMGCGDQPEVITERLWWLDDLSDWLAASFAR